MGFVVVCQDLPKTWWVSLWYARIRLGLCGICYSVPGSGLRLGGFWQNYNLMPVFAISLANKWKAALE